jgi:hypothetical protein
MYSVAISEAAIKWLPSSKVPSNSELPALQRVLESSPSLGVVPDQDASQVLGLRCWEDPHNRLSDDGHSHSTLPRHVQVRVSKLTTRG